MRGIRKQVGAAWLPVDEQAPFTDLDIEPVDWDAESGCKVICAQTAGIVVPPVTLNCDLDASSEPYALHGGWKNLIGTVGRSVPFMRQGTGDLIVWHPGPREFKQTVMHLFAPGQSGDRIDPHLDVEFGHRAAAPYDPCRGNIAGAPIQNYFVDQTAQQRFAMGIGGGRILPYLGKAIVKGDDFAVQGFAYHPL